MVPDFVLSLGLILVICKFSKSVKPFTKWYQPLIFTAWFMVLDIISNAVTLVAMALGCEHH